MNNCYICITVPYALTSGGYNGVLVTENLYGVDHTEIKPVLITYSTAVPAKLETSSVNRFLLCLIVGSV